MFSTIFYSPKVFLAAVGMGVMKRIWSVLLEEQWRNKKGYLEEIDKVSVRVTL